MNKPGEERFWTAYERLNPAQKEAVDTIEGPVMVIAGPGTGKTQILTLRIANILLKTDTPASGILALTFTEAGRKAMRLRLRELIGSRADEVAIFTYHGFAAATMAEFPEHFPHLARSRQLSEVESEALVRDILREKKFAKLRPLGDPEFYVGRIIRAVSEARKEAWTPEFLATYAQAEIDRLNADPASLSTRGASRGKLKAEVLKQIEKGERTILLSQVYAEYEARKREQRRHDFDDLIFELLLALQADELLLRLLQERYLYLLVDEHQDTNNAQNELVEKLADFYETPNLFVVGDEKQAIYRFQGASVENFLQFQKRWPGMKVISLEHNYRSQQSLLDAAFPMIEENYAPGEHAALRLRLKAAGPEQPEPVELVLAGNNEAAEQYLTRAIKDVSEQSPEKTVAVIVRTNREVERALEVLGNAGLAASAERGANIFTHPIGVLFFKLIEFLADPSQTESLAYTLGGGLWDLDLPRAATLIKELRRGSLDLATKELPALVRLQEMLATAGPIEFLILAASLSGLTGRATSEPLAMEVWRSLVVLAEDLAAHQHLADPRQVIKELLDYRRLAETRSLKITAGVNEAQILVMTAHAAKGLEYDYVFLPYATEESWLPHGRGESFLLPLAKQENDEIRDARRLFYVALTRARRHVSILVSLADAPERPLSPLRFIDELDQSQIARVELPKAATTGQPTAPLSPETRDRLETWEYAKRRLLEDGLSVTALNHFITCPSQFFYKSILKLPEPPAPAAEKGSAMHEAIAAVWLLPEKTVEKITETLRVNLKNYLARSFLSPNDREILEAELLNDAPKVAAALQAHFATRDKVWAEKWEETTFLGQFKEREISLRLHGKLDVIVETAEKVEVYDYKTRVAMSENAIRGETKSSDGNYFRQLIFYKILLDENYRYGGKPIKPALVFVKPDAQGRCPIVSLEITAADVTRVRKEIQDLITSVWSGEFLTATCADPKCEFCQLKRLSQT